MEFWGVEVEAGKPLKVTPEAGKLVHISQAALGETRTKGTEIVPLRVKIGNQKLVLGALSTDKTPQVVFDLVFHKEFELSHDWKHGSVHFLGYVATSPSDDEGSDTDEESEEDEEFEIGPSLIPAIGKPIETKAKTAKIESSSKPKVSIVEPTKDSSDDDSDEDMDGDSDDSDDSDDDDDDDSSEEEEETPQKPILNDKKRANESASKTPVQAKKAKIDITPQKKDGKKVGHVATPYPAKQAGKTQAATKNNPNGQSPKSDAKFSCKSCTKTFLSDGALQSHSRAKHAAK